eukprot:8997425-Karenia_brevis.AAC.1
MAFNLIGTALISFWHVSGVMLRHTSVIAFLRPLYCRRHHINDDDDDGDDNHHHHHHHRHHHCYHRHHDSLYERNFNQQQ